VREAFQTLRLMVTISLRADAVRSAAAVVTALGQQVTIPLRAIGLMVLADGIVEQEMRRAMLGAFLIAGLTGLHRLMAWASLTVRMRLRENTQLYLDAYLMGLTAGVPGIAHHELPEYLDRVELLRNERHHLANPFNPISWTIASLLQSVSVLALLGGIHPLLALLPLAGIPAVLAGARAQHSELALLETQAEDNRVLRHLAELTTEPPAAKEIRLYGLADELIARRRQLFDRLEAKRVRLATRNSAVVSLAWGLFALAYAAAVAWGVHLAEQGRVTVGAVVLVLGLGAQIGAQLSELGFHVAWFVSTHRAVRRLVWFRDYAEAAHAAVAPANPVPVPNRLSDGIRFEAVSFAYPGTDRTILEDVDLLLPAGATVAIVGDNGAGKTTLVKLLARMYEPATGRITVDGVDLRAFEVAKWRARISAGFQDFARLQLIARESVGVGDAPRAESDSHVLSALDRAVAADLPASLPSGLATQLGLEFENGFELSIGQWQKVALGRAMMRLAPLLLTLDEPTASLDAPTEHALFERFAAAAKEAAQRSGAITLLVSHRFSTVRMADLIVVIDDGRIIESGSHEQLIARGGTYAELFTLQATAYA
jgi:ATP-binding cassette, subfamily B, bacterial